MKRLVLIAALAVTACAPRPAPEPIVRTVTVNVPVPVPCDVAVDRNDVQIAPMIRAAPDILARVEILIDYAEYLAGLLEVERKALDTCRSAGPPPDPG